MPILRRADNQVFVFQPYRETLTIKNTSLSRKEIRYLAQSHGKNVRLFKQVTGEFEAVFSPEPGFLLAEMIWHYLQMPDNLIYCESLEGEDQQVLLVIVRDGKVYLDTKLSLNNLTENFTSFITETEHYDMVVYGAFNILLDKHKFKSLHQLDKPLFPLIPITNTFRLLPLDEALAEHHLKGGLPYFWLLIPGIILAGIFWHYTHMPVQQLQQQKVTSPYRQFQLALQTPDPTQTINSLVNNLQKIYNLNGWYASDFGYENGSGKLAMHSLGGTAIDLLEWSKQSQMNVDFSEDGAALIFTASVAPRTVPNHIYDIRQVIALIIDRMMLILPGRAVKINKVMDNQTFRQMSITITFNNISPEILQLVGSNLSGLPVSLNNCSASIKAGLLSGKLQLDVLGS